MGSNRRRKALVSGDEGCIVRTRGERQVNIRTLAGPSADLVSIATIKRVIVGRVGMDGAVEHVVPCVEQRLRAIAVVGIEVDDSDAWHEMPQNFSRDGSIVEEAKAGCPVRIGVMPRRTAERVGSL